MTSKKPLLESSKLEYQTKLYLMSIFQKKNYSRKSNRFNDLNQKMTSVQPTFRYREERYSDRYSESRPRDDRYDSYRRESSSSRLGLKISDD